MEPDGPALLRPRRWLAAAGLELALASPLLLGWLGDSQFGYPERPAYGSTLAWLDAVGQAADLNTAWPT